MPVRFIIGRAGTGKTYHCVNALAAAMRESPLGPPLIWLLPEQATFNAQRALLSHPQIRGTFRASVTGFRRLVHLLAADLGISDANQLDDLGRIILLEDLVQRNRQELRLFRRVADRPGFIANLDRMLRELLQQGHTPQTLRDVAAQISTRRTDPVLADKLADLALLLDAWQVAVRQRHLDPDLLVQTVADRMGESALLRQAHIWIDAFSAMNLMEIRMLVALASAASSVEITLLADPNATAIADPNAPLDELSPFYRTERLYRQLQRTFSTARIPIDPPLSLHDQPPHRFARSADLARVESDLFHGEPSANDDRTPPRDVQLLACANPQTEVQAAAQRIRQLIASDSTLRYRDIGLIIPDLDGYQDAVRRVFTQHNIPHFIDARRPVTHHPLVELLRSAVAFPLNRFATDDLVLLIKTGLSNISDDDANGLENYLLAHGITHHTLADPFIFAAPNTSGESDEEPLTDVQRAYLGQVNQIRQSLHAVLAPWFAITDQSRTTSVPISGQALSRALFALLQRFDVERKINSLMDQARSAGDPELVLIHQQVWRQIVNLLEALDRTLQDRATTPAEFYRILSEALASLTLGLIPPTLDQVLVSSVARSRHPEMRIAMILGAVESRFPLIRSEDPLLSDFQRETFNQAATNPIAAGSAQDLLETKFLDYIAFTRAGERLIVSYPIADQTGRAVVRSQYISRLCALFPRLVAENIDSAAQHELNRIATRDDLTASLLRRARARSNAAPLEPESSAANVTESRMTAAYDWLLATPDPAALARFHQAWRALLPPEVVRIDPALAARFHGTQLRMSVTQLEKFGSCPLQYFMHYTLGLKPRAVLQLEMLDIGILYHRILERVYDCVIRGEVPWPKCDPLEMVAILQRESLRAAEELHQELAGSFPNYAAMLARAQRSLARVLEGQRRAASQNSMRPAATEVLFGRRSDADAASGARKITLPVLTINTPTGRTVALNGKIDRVDLSHRGGGIKGDVIDYKSGGVKQLDLYKIYHGIALQLPIYLLVLRECGQAIAGGAVEPMAAFFVGLTQKRRSQSDLRQTIDPASDKFYQQDTPRGVLDALHINCLDESIDDENVTKSQWFKYNRTKAGTLAKTGNDAVEHADFAAILAFTQHKIAEMADRLAAGSIAPAPYRAKQEIPCEHCDFIAVCPFDRINGDFRELATMDRNEALEAMKGRGKD